MIDEELFHHALQKPTLAEQIAFLQEACSDEAIRQRVERLLRSHRREDSFLQVPTTTDEPQAERAGTMIGPYKLLEQIGEGGMGTVWMAQQTEPVRRLVALKLIKAGLDSRQVIARFEAERQALALMDHPNIARVLDAGTTATGRPYFVMDLVKGVPITKFCDEHCLTPRQRLEQLIPVCEAIQHAHQKGIIHRDLKPCNVLVALYDGKPVPKVIDFGVAKAVGQSLTDKTLVTGFGAIVGTLEYMSPEQAEINQLDIDTRSDVYSLGVLLYELLTGSPPFSRKDLERAGVLEMLRVIREQEPPKPSTKLSTAQGLPTLAANRSTEPAKLTRLVRGELDWIVMKSLEKDRNCRYESANGFAADLQRYLNNEAVQACPPSAAYRLRKFVRRNRAALLTAAVVTLAVLGVAGAVGWAAWDRQAREERLAREELERAAGVSAQVQEILAEVSRLQGQEKWVDAEAAARRAEAVLLAAGRPLAESEAVRGAVAELRLVAQLESARLVPDVDRRNFDFDTMDRAYREAFAGTGVDIFQAPLDEVSRRLRLYPAIRAAIVFTLDDWASLCRGRPDATENHRRLTLLSQAIDDDPVRNRVRRAILDDRHEELAQLADSANLPALSATTLWLLGVAQRDANHRVKIFRVAQLQYPGDFWINHTLAKNLIESLPERLEEGVTFLQIALAIRPNTKIRVGLGHAMARLKRLDEAEAIINKGIELHPEYGGYYWALAFVCQRRGKIEDAIALNRKAIKVTPRHAMAHSGLGECLRVLKRLDESAAVLTKAIQLDSRVSWAWNNLGLTLRDKGELDESIACHRKAIELDPRLPFFQHTLGVAVQRKGEALQGKGQLNEAIDCFLEAIEIAPTDAGRHNNLGNALIQKGQLDDAIVYHRKAIQLNPNYFPFHTHLGIALDKKGQPDEAIACYRKAIELNPKDFPAHNLLGLSLRKKGRLDDAIACFRKAIELTATHPDPHYYLAWLYHYDGQFAKAEPHYRDALKRAQERDGPASLSSARLMGSLGLNLLKQQKYAYAEPILRECLVIRAQKQPKHWSTYNAQSMLGASLLGQRKYADAKPLLLEGGEGLMQWEAKISSADDKMHVFDALDRVIEFYDATGKKDEAARWRKTVDGLEGSRIAGELHQVDKDLRLEGRLDPAVKSLIYQVRLVAGETYVIEMIRSDSEKLDPFLRLKNASGKRLAENDDSAGNLNARIVFRAEASALHLIQAASFGFAGRGDFTLTVKRQE